MTQKVLYFYLQDPVSGVVCRSIMAQEVVVADEPVLPAQIDQPPGGPYLAGPCHVVAAEVAAHDCLGVGLLAGRTAGLDLHAMLGWFFSLLNNSF